MDDEPTVYLTKDTFVKRIIELNLNLSKIGLRYTNAFLKEKDAATKAWMKQQVDEISADISINANLLRRAEIETGYNLFWATHSGNMASRRCTRREYLEIYGKRPVTKHYT